MPDRLRPSIIARTNAIDQQPVSCKRSQWIFCEPFVDVLRARVPTYKREHRSGMMIRRCIPCIIAAEWAVPIAINKAKIP